MAPLIGWHRREATNEPSIAVARPAAPLGAATGCISTLANLRQGPGVSAQGENSAIDRLRHMDAFIRLKSHRQLDDMISLTEWLRGERGLKGSVQPVRSAPAETELGTIVDMISVAVGTGGTVTVLVNSLNAWLQTRRSEVKLTVSHGDRSVTVDASNVNNVREVIEAALRAGDDAE